MPPLHIQEHRQLWQLRHLHLRLLLLHLPRLLRHPFRRLQCLSWALMLRWPQQSWAVSLHLGQAPTRFVPLVFFGIQGKRRRRGHARSST